jgi:hypothetical protein
VKPDIVVFSAGAHLHDTGDIYSTLENVRSLLPAMIENVRLSTGKNLSFVWKTQSPGHVSCDAVSEPQTYELAPAHLDRWQWNLHQYFDDFIKTWSTIMNYKVGDIVICMIKKWIHSSRTQTPVCIQVIDMSPLYFRADAHPGSGDCLHYCIPGPLNLFSVLFMNKLLYGEI